MHYSIAQLNKEDEERLKQIEKELGLILIAYHPENETEQKGSAVQEVTGSDQYGRFS